MTEWSPLPVRLATGINHRISHYMTSGCSVVLTEAMLVYAREGSQFSWNVPSQLETKLS